MERAVAKRKRVLVRIIPPVAIIILMSVVVLLLQSQRYDVVTKGGERCKLDRLTGKLTPLEYVPTEGSEISAERKTFLTIFLGLVTAEGYADSMDWEKVEKDFPELDVDILRSKVANRRGTSAGQGQSVRPSRAPSFDEWKAQRQTLERLLDECLKEEFK